MNAVKSKWMISGLVAVSIMSMAALSSLDQVNAKMVEVLKPLNNAKTKAVVAFTALKIDSEKTLNFGLKGQYSKVGKDNYFKIDVRNVKYTYGDGTAPKASGEVIIATDLVKALTQETINALGESLVDLSKQFASDIGEKYGEALIVDSKMTNVRKDQNGNYISANLQLKAVVDLKKLPAGVTAADVEATLLQGQITFQPKGITGSIQVVLNPKYKGFSHDGAGLKEYIELLLNNDEATYQEISTILGYVDRMAEGIVDNSK